MNSQSFDSKAIRIIYIVSAAVLAFLFWLIYFNQGASTELAFVDKLPFLNAFLNSVTAILLVIGFIFIKRKQKQAHIYSMLSATATSGFFLISYITYHHFHGDTKFIAEGLIRPVYFTILISHILLSVIMVPMIFTTLYFAATKNWEKHKKLAKKTFPIWLYVSVTGVLIFIFLQYFNQ